MSIPGSLSLWIAIAAMIAVALLFVLPRLVSRKTPSAGVSSAELNSAVHRSLLVDLEGERASRTLSQAGYAQAREDLERRVLDETEAEPPLAMQANRGTAATIALVLPSAAIALYFVFGDPAWVNDTRAPAADSPAFRARLADHLASHPRDGRGWVMLARIDMAGDRFADAVASYEKALAASAKIAGDPDVWCELADALGMARGGELAGEPTKHIERALAIDARHPRALEMAGSAAYQRGDFRVAARFWNELVALVPAEARRELHAAIARAERRASVMLPPPEPKSTTLVRH